MKNKTLSLVEVIYIISTIFLFLSGIYTFVFIGDDETGMTLISMSILSLLFTIYMIRINNKVQQ